ncbi:MAG: tautomerase family protein [Methylobacteriaceae bacterium]|nr:tautomerase family protein [Methylobacteriaceae bacterium]MBV9243289.1 tautomerase family protein [Methylobacteriaceae bacterium]MBV9702668.1 tautomerase family protein [Methylobacteriaceae bacterium]
MPLTRVSMRLGTSPAYRKAILDGIYQAMRETFDVPENDRFMVITEHEPDNLDHAASYLGIDYSDDLVLVQLTVSNTRSVEQKKALFKRIAERLGRDPGLRPEDVFVNLVEVAKENWSFGRGLAQYAM